MYEWDPGEDPEEQDNESILDPELYEPKSKVASLQALFAMMQYTKRKYADPTDFICKLGLNPSVQQDAQEFSKLFVSLLENSLAHQTNSDIKSMIQRLFRGEYAYVTKCLTCNRESIRPSFFYELDLALAGNKTLTIEKCLEDFLKIEQMTGDEKYFCEGCEAKQDATRCCKLRELPPVLNLQLNRFQYDMQFGRKKKLNSCILYPEELDMSKYLEDAEKVISSIFSIFRIICNVDLLIHFYVVLECLLTILIYFISWYGIFCVVLNKSLYLDMQWGHFKFEDQCIIVSLQISLQGRITLRDIK